MNVFLKNKDYRRFSIASFLSTAGDILFYLAFMTYASKLHNYSLALSLIAISESIPRLFDIFAGYLADKTKRKFQNIFLMAVVRFILYGIVGLLFISNVSQWNLVIAVVIINFLSDTFGSYSGGLTAPLIVDIVGKKEFGEAEGFSNGMNEVINTVAQFVGSGLLLFLSFANLAFINALTFLVAGLLFLSVGLKHRKDQKPLEAQEVNDQKFFATMKSSYKQMKKAQGLLTVIFVIALVNGMLTALGSLIPIVIAGNKATMVITSYSFTIAVMGVVVSCGAILGSMFGPQLFKKASVFTMTIIAIILSFATIIAAVFANMYAILVAYFFLAATASIASIKMQQWLVNTIEHKILASSVGLLNTILMAVAPIFTTVLTSISGFASVKYALFALIAVEVIIFFVAIKMGAKTREKKTVNATAVVTK
ncbi:MFS transporter [Lactobacillus kefiranofaciens subsp. kefirgranum]|nr:MFS transporter [Lactobacillus kefiranofaciens]KRL30999.1 major facilitator superfamily permease [Lactobacillus kefiranofaciens subsp. kefirgranum DSM 10550 = JCM 8572]MCJ2172917.1 MFS transporter [Lactobacillus kefiranofaciens]MCP9330639.1 MFS transporter [Lactobacillus kefiranofaciens]QNT44110.1 MFS transporter [Lactobacillus kefiranofaciens]URW70995.1 MFS transporter [Lactobacillus kefiranofaciens subsp. kefirgranum]